MGTFDVRDMMKADAAAAAASSATLLREYRALSAPPGESTEATNG